MKKGVMRDGMCRSAEEAKIYTTAVVVVVLGPNSAVQIAEFWRLLGTVLTPSTQQM